MEPGHLALFLTFSVELIGALGIIEGLHRRRHERLQKKIEALAKFHVEHEMLIYFFCEMSGRNRWDLPTRHTNGTLRGQD